MTTSSQARTWRTSVIQDRIAELTSFHQRLEDWLSREIKVLRGGPKGLHRLPAEKRIEVEQLYSDEHFMLETVFTKTLRFSVLVTAHTLLETSLNATCSGEQKRYDHRLGLKDLAGQGVTRARLYLTKVCGVGFPNSTAEWKRMAALGDLRNVIAHADGDVSKATNEQKVRNLVKNTSGLSLRHGKHLEVTDDFVQDTLAKMDGFFSQLHQAFSPRVRAT
jgi:hypothetical protein